MPQRVRGTAAAKRDPFILVVDDFADTRELFSESLRNSGFLTETAEDGAQAVAKARALHPDVIVMDMTMPVVDGWESMRTLRADPATRDIVIIAVAGKPLPDHGKSAYEAGCDEYLTKPLSADALTRAVRHALACAEGKEYRVPSTPRPPQTGSAPRAVTPRPTNRRPRRSR